MYDKKHDFPRVYIYIYSVPRDSVIYIYMYTISPPLSATRRVFYFLANDFLQQTVETQKETDCLHPRRGNTIISTRAIDFQSHSI